MTRRWVFAVLMAVGGFCNAAAAQTADPADPVRRLYQAYGLAGTPQAELSRGWNAADLFSHSLLRLYQAAKSGMDIDFFTQSQDFSGLAAPVEIDKVTTVGDRATISATVLEPDTDKKAGRPHAERFVFSVLREGGRWRIDNATHGGQTLRQEWLSMSQG